MRDYTRNNYQEDVYQDPYWGRVVRQQFTTPKNQSGSPATQTEHAHSTSLAGNGPRVFNDPLW